jgi:hypothetical protein
MIADWFASSEPENPMWPPLIDVIARVTILYLLACAFHCILGRRRALVRSALWNAVLLAAILQSAAALGLPRLRIACLSAEEVTRSRATTLVPPDFDEPPSPRLHDVGGTPTTPAVAFLDPADPLQPGWHWLGLSRRGLGPAFSVLMGVYAVGVMILFFRLIFAIAAVARLKRTAWVVDDPAWTGPLSGWRIQLRIARPVTLVRSGRVRVPMLLGFLRPVIVLPNTAEAPAPIPGFQIDAILLHELAHLRRGDDLWNLLQQVVQILYWPHPLVWLGARLIAGVREQACDDLCVRWVGGAGEYRCALVAVASGLVRGPIPSIPTSLGLAMARARSSALLRRLRWIDRSRGASACLLGWPGRLAIGVVVLNLGLVLCSIELTRVQAAESTFASERMQNAGPVRAYDQTLPSSAKFHTSAVTVLDDETGKPLPGVEVRVLEYVELKYHSFPTDESGRLRFEYPYTGARPMLNIEFRKNGYVPLHRGWGFGDGSDATEAFTVRLRRGTTMGGIVVYAADRPVEGVTVVMTVQEYGPEKRPENPTGYENYYEVPTRTGTDGRWRTDSVPPGALKVNLQLIHADFVSDSTTFFGVPGRSPKVADLRDLADRQVLIKGVKISGRVLDTQGNPIRGADVVDSTRGFTFVDYLRNAQTDADGRFHFHLARGGDMTLTLQVKGYQPSTVQARAEAGASPIEIRLAPSRGLRGRVVDAQGKPIAGVGIMSKAIGMHKEISLRLFTDAQGRFVWDGAPDEKVGMTIFAEGFFPIESMPLGATEQEMVIVLKPALDVRLRVVDAGTGKPVPRFGIQIGKANKGNQEFRWEVPTIGTFEGEYHTSLAGEDGPYQFKVIADGYEPAQTRVFRGEEKSVREVIRLKNEHE